MFQIGQKLVNKRYSNESVERNEERETLQKLSASIAPATR